MKLLRAVISIPGVCILLSLLIGVASVVLAFVPIINGSPYYHPCPVSIEAELDKARNIACNNPTLDDLHDSGNCFNYFHCDQLDKMLEEALKYCEGELSRERKKYQKQLKLPGKDLNKIKSQIADIDREKKELKDLIGAKKKPCPIRPLLFTGLAFYAVGWLFLVAWCLTVKGCQNQQNDEVLIDFAALGFYIAFGILLCGAALVMGFRIMIGVSTFPCTSSDFSFEDCAQTRDDTYGSLFQTLAVLGMLVATGLCLTGGILTSLLGFQPFCRKWEKVDDNQDKIPIEEAEEEEEGEEGEENNKKGNEPEGTSEEEPEEDETSETTTTDGENKERKHKKKKKRRKKLKPKPEEKEPVVRSKIVV